MARLTTNIALDKDLHSEVKKYCDENGLKRKWFIHRAIRDALSKVVKKK